MASSRFPIPQGTLDMLILQILSLEPAHGYAIARRLQQISRDVVHVNQGSLYPALHRPRTETLAEIGVAPVGNRPRGQVLFAHQGASHAAAVEKTGWDRLTATVQLIFNEGG